MADDIAAFRDSIGAGPGTGDSVVFRRDGTVPLTHAQMDHNLWLLAKQAINNYNARQGKYVNAEAIGDAVLEQRHFGANSIPASAIGSEVQRVVSPPGMIVPYAGTFWDETNLEFILCDGREVTVSSYPELFGVIGNTYGTAGGGKFRVPDLRGRFVLGSSTGLVSVDNLRVQSDVGDVGGEAQHTLTKEEMPDHHHKFMAARDFRGYDNGSGNAWGFNRGVALYESDTLLNISEPESVRIHNSGGTGHTDNISTGADNPQYNVDGTLTGPGGDEAHDTVPPYVALNYLIKG